MSLLGFMVEPRWTLKKCHNLEGSALINLVNDSQVEAVVMVLDSKGDNLIILEEPVIDHVKIMEEVAVEATMKAVVAATQEVAAVEAMTAAATEEVAVEALMTEVEVAAILVTEEVEEVMKIGLHHIDLAIVSKLTDRQEETIEGNFNTLMNN